MDDEMDHDLWASEHDPEYREWVEWVDSLVNDEGPDA